MIVVPDLAIEGYGRLLPVIQDFRGDDRYEVLDVANRPDVAATLGEARSVTISGPCSAADLERRFTLPSGLRFERQSATSVWLLDEGIGITFRPRRSRWLDGWRALERW